MRFSLGKSLKKRVYKKAKKHTRRHKKSYRKNKKYGGGEENESQEESKYDKLERLQKEVELKKEDVKEAKADWNRAAIGQHAQPDYFWVTYYEDCVEELEKEIEKVEKEMENDNKKILK
jgi:hypothetical protein